ncbi:MAG: hypothetical protein Q8K36_06410, partial [Alphaproteobacteria bacterium]|nr:hypothetical protein [Alphaproteobacteria bacterium]
LHSVMRALNVNSLMKILQNLILFLSIVLHCVYAVQFDRDQPFNMPPANYDKLARNEMEFRLYRQLNPHFAEASQNMHVLKKKAEEEFYALDSVLHAFVKNELEGVYDINSFVRYILQLGIGIEYVPHQYLCLWTLVTKLHHNLANEDMTKIIEWLLSFSAL